MNRLLTDSDRKKKMKTALLVTLANEDYLDQAKQLFSSVYWNAGWHGDYLLLAYQIPEEKLSWFNERNILVKKIEKISELKFCRPAVSQIKFLLFTPEFKKWSHIIYLDADIIVKRSLFELTKVKRFSAVPDLGMPRLAHQIRGIKKRDESLYNDLKQRFNIKVSAFNSGVFAFNTDIIHQTTYQNLMDLFQQYYQQDLIDQPILNLYFYKNWQKLSSIYNVQLDFVSKAYKIKNPNAAVLHFTCETKPWKVKKFQEEWNQNLSLAEQINLKKISHSAKKITPFDVFRFNITFGFYNYLYLIYRQIGKTGQLLKKYSPELYFKLKNIRN